ncbi:MAG: hypothetical protein C4537_07815 [Acholeplasma sp.]|jgi:hypothetical protein|nr:MAG: hypothetical protein C4537_07815 [Acholeplasma sp.]
MILPKKHINLSESLLGLSAIVLSRIEEDKNIDEIYVSVARDKRTPKSTDIDTIVLCLDFLFAIGLVHLNENGGVVKCN